MKKIALLLLFALPMLASAQPAQATLLGHWTDPTIPPTTWYNNPFNEIWGFTHGGREYGVIGSTAGMSFFDVTNPENPKEKFRVPGDATGPGIIHRDFKDWRGYLYAVCDEGASKLQVIDLNQLPDTVRVVYASNEFASTAHNLYIDTAQARLYLLGASGNTVCLDISNPATPKLLAKYPGNGLNLPYVHDAYIQNHIGIMNCGSDGLWVVDFSAPTQPVLLGTMTNYPGAGYNHSGWMSADGRHYILCDETHGSPVKMVDMSDFSDLKVISSINAGSFSGQIPHNAIVRENLFFVSYYYDGLQVFDISDPFAPKRVLYYDTYPGANQNSYAGSWGVNPMLPSGNILLSDMQSGFWVFGPAAQPTDYQLRTNKSFIVTCAGSDSEIELSIGRDFAASGVSLLAANVPAGASVEIPSGAMPDQKVVVKIKNLPLGDNALRFSATDGTKTGESLLHIIVKPAPPAPQLSFPADAALDVSLAPLLKWATLPNVGSYTVQVSTSATDFEQNIVFSATKATAFANVPSGILAEGTTYFWRVLVGSFCGAQASPMYSFTTKITSSVADLGGNAFQIFPNPVADFCQIEFKNPVFGPIFAEISDATGRTVAAEKLPAGSQTLRLDLKNLPAGAYALRLASGEFSASLPIFRR